MDIIKKSLVRISEPNIFESDIPIIGKTKTIFNMLDPTIFPMTRFPFFCFKATKDVANSGRLVPIATIVNPITTSDIPINEAMLDPYFTVNSEPISRNTRLESDRKINHRVLFESDQLLIS